MVEKKPGERKIVQVAQVVEDIDAVMRHYWEILSIGPWEVYTFAPPVLRECTFKGKPSDATWALALAWVGDTQLELMQPLSGESVYTHFLEKRVQVSTILKNGWMTARRPSMSTGKRA